MQFIPLRISNQRELLRCSIMRILKYLMLPARIFNFEKKPCISCFISQGQGRRWRVWIWKCNFSAILESWTLTQNTNEWAGCQVTRIEVKALRRYFRKIFARNLGFVTGMHFIGDKWRESLKICLSRKKSESLHNLST